MISKYSNLNGDLHVIPEKSKFRGNHKFITQYSEMPKKTTPLKLTAENLRRFDEQKKVRIYELTIIAKIFQSLTLEFDEFNIYLEIINRIKQSGNRSFLLRSKSHIKY